MQPASKPLTTVVQSLITWGGVLSAYSIVVFTATSMGNFNSPHKALSTALPVPKVLQAVSGIVPISRRGTNSLFDLLSNLIGFILDP